MKKYLVLRISESVRNTDHFAFTELMKRFQATDLVAIMEFGETSACRNDGDIGPILTAARTSDPFFLKTLLHKLEEVGNKEYLKKIVMGTTLYDNETAFENAIAVASHENLQELLRCVGGITTLRQKEADWPERLLLDATQRLKISPSEERKKVVNLLG